MNYSRQLTATTTTINAHCNTITNYNVHFMVYARLWNSKQQEQKLWLQQLLEGLECHTDTARLWKTTTTNTTWADPEGWLGRKNLIILHPLSDSWRHWCQKNKVSPQRDVTRLACHHVMAPGELRCTAVECYRRQRWRQMLATVTSMAPHYV